jgi:predicted kinase
MLNKPSLVLMAGLPGTGKTTLSKELGKQSYWAVLHADTIKYALFDSGLSKENAAYIAYEVLFALAKDILVHQKKSVILDSSARSSSIVERAVDLAHLGQIQLKVIYCTVSKYHRHQRLKARTERILHPTNKAFTGDAEHQQIYNHLPANTLRLDTALSLEECVIEAQKYLLLEMR